jgi:hypothetical protein
VQEEQEEQEEKEAGVRVKMEEDEEEPRFCDKSLLCDLTKDSETQQLQPDESGRIQHFSRIKEEKRKHTMGFRGLMGRIAAE